MNKLLQIIFLASAIFAFFGQVCESAEILRQDSGPEVDLAPVDSGEVTTETPDVDQARRSMDCKTGESYYRNACSRICVSYNNSKLIQTR